MAECQDFAQFGLAPNLLSAITRMGYTQPTAIQCTAIPVVLQGRDVMGAAQTGTGKTASFGLPVLQKLLPLANTSTSPGTPSCTCFDSFSDKRVGRSNRRGTFKLRS